MDRFLPALRGSFGSTSSFRDGQQTAKSSRSGVACFDRTLPHPNGCMG